MFEIFQSSGIRQDFRERLKSVVRAGEMDSAVPLSIWLEISSGPEAVLTFCFESSCWTSSRVAVVY